jgi:hypothetical protein
MRKIRIDAATIVRDIRQGADIEALMEKYGLSFPNLLKVKRALLEKGLASSEELDYLTHAEASAGKSLSAKEFLASFRKRPDDMHLMERYGLKAKDLKRIYEKLIQAGLLSEYEYHSRDGKAPELEDPANTVSEVSTEVTFLTNDFGAQCAIRERGRDITPRKTYPNDSFANGTSSMSSQILKPKSTAPVLNEESAARLCPRCRRPRHPSSSEACIYCGVIFSKAKRDAKYEGVTIWETDYDGR